MQAQNNPELEEILAECSVSIEKHALMFHSGRFNKPFGPRHGELFEVLDDNSVKKVLFIAHRGFGKTSLLNFALPSQYIHHPGVKDVSYIVTVSASATSAVIQSENLKMELMGSEISKAVIGDIKTDNFSKEQWTTSNGVRIFPRGNHQQIRGILFGNARPGLIVVDDLENSESVMSKEQRVKLKEWFLTDLMNAIDPAGTDWRIIVGGTILHEDALLQDLRDDSSWTKIEIPLCDDKFKSYWPMRFSDDRVKEIREGYVNQGFVEGFYREFMNISNPREDAAFRPEYFVHYNESDLDLNNAPGVDNFVIVDPAKTAKVHSDDSAIVGVASDNIKNMIYLRDCVNGKFFPNDIYRETFDMAERINARVIGIEVTGLNEFILQPFLDEMLRRGKIYEIVELKARKGEGDYAARGRGKEGRVAAMVSYFRTGRILLNATCSGPLESQLLAFPRSKYWDVMDAFAYFIEMRALGMRYFSSDVPKEDELAQYRVNKKEQKELEKAYEQLKDQDAEAIPEGVYSVI